MIFRVHYAVKGGHVHCRVFLGTPGVFAKCGDLIVRRGPEFVALMSVMNGATDAPDVEFISDAESAEEGLEEACTP